MLKFFLPAVLMFATFVGAGEVIHACVDSTTGAIRIVGADIAKWEDLEDSGNVRMNWGNCQRV